MAPFMYLGRSLVSILMFLSTSHFSSLVRFKKEYFRKWVLTGDAAVLGDTKYSLSDCRGAIACDLAWKEKRESDFSVILPGLLTPNSEILIMPYINQKGLRPDKLANLLFEFVAHLESLTGSTVPIGFEKAMLENVSKWFLRREMKARNKFLMTRELKWDVDKNMRIETRLLPRYMNGAIYHREGMGDLEYELERFPYGTHDDLIDAAQGLVQLLQFPKAKSKVQEGEDQFMWWRRQSMNMTAKKKTFIGRFRSKGRVPLLPAKEAWR